MFLPTSDSFCLITSPWYVTYSCKINRRSTFHDIVQYNLTKAVERQTNKQICKILTFEDENIWIRLYLVKYAKEMRENMYVFCHLQTGTTLKGVPSAGCLWNQKQLGQSWCWSGLTARSCFYSLRICEVFLWYSLYLCHLRAYENRVNSFHM